MELYKELVSKRCFTRGDLIDITGSEYSASWRIRDYLSRGYIERIRRDLYVVISLEDAQPIANRYQIASSLADDACVCGHSAFEYYGCGNQVFNEVYVSTQKRFESFVYDGVEYKKVKSNGLEGTVETWEGVRVTTPERTVVDGISNFDLCGGLEELLRCMALMPSLSEEKLLGILKLRSCGKVYQKAGYILEYFRDEFGLSDSFFDECERNLPDSKSYLDKRHDNFALDSRWRLYAPRSLDSFIDKGVDRYANV